MLAATNYGLAAVFGMTIVAGLVEIVLSLFLDRLRVFFPPAISGFIVVIVGIQLGLVGIDHVLNVAAYGGPAYTQHLIVSVLTLALIVGLSVWAEGMARLNCASNADHLYIGSVAMDAVRKEAIRRGYDSLKLETGAPSRVRTTACRESAYDGRVGPGNPPPSVGPKERSSIASICDMP